MAVIQERPPQATSNTEAETAPADMQGTRTIPTTSLCDPWVELSPTQAMGLDGDRAPPEQQGTGPPRPDALVGPPARQPAIVYATIPAGGLRHTPRQDIVDIYEEMEQVCSGPLGARWRRTLRPHYRCCMGGEEVRLDHATREVYKYSELRSNLMEFAEEAILQWWDTLIAIPGNMSLSILKVTTAAMASLINHQIPPLLDPAMAEQWRGIRHYLTTYKMQASTSSHISEVESTWEVTPILRGTHHRLRPGARGRHRSLPDPPQAQQRAHQSLQREGEPGQLGRWAPLIQQGRPWGPVPPRKP